MAKVETQTSKLTNRTNNKEADFLESFFFGGEVESLNTSLIEETKDNQKWLVRCVADFDIERIRSFSCTWKQLPQKVFEDEYYQEVNRYDVKQKRNLNDEDLLKVITTGLQKQTNGFRVIPLKNLENGLDIKMRSGGYK